MRRSAWIEASGKVIRNASGTETQVTGSSGRITSMMFIEGVNLRVKGPLCAVK